MKWRSTIGFMIKESMNALNPSDQFRVRSMQVIRADEISSEKSMINNQKVSGISDINY